MKRIHSYGRSTHINLDLSGSLDIKNRKRKPAYKSTCVVAMPPTRYLLQYVTSALRRGGGQRDPVRGYATSFSTFQKRIMKSPAYPIWSFRSILSTSSAVSYPFSAVETTACHSLLPHVPRASKDILTAFSSISSILGYTR